MTKPRQQRKCKVCNKNIAEWNKSGYCSHCNVKKKKIEEKKREELIKKYKELRQELEKEIHSATLNKFKILNEAFNVGREIYGKNYTVHNLCYDFEYPYTTCKRILSLRKANSKTWKLIKANKISSFKVAMILLQKNVTYQDELVDLVIKENLSTYDIKNLKDGSLKEVNDNRLDIAIQKGFCRQTVAFESFSRYFGRVNSMMVVEINDFPKTKLKKMKEILEETDKNIKEFKNKIEQNEKNK